MHSGIKSCSNYQQCSREQAGTFNKTDLKALGQKIVAGGNAQLGNLMLKVTFTHSRWGASRAASPTRVLYPQFSLVSPASRGTLSGSSCSKGRSQSLPEESSFLLFLVEHHPPKHPTHHLEPTTHLLKGWILYVFISFLTFCNKEYVSITSHGIV